MELTGLVLLHLKVMLDVVQICQRITHGLFHQIRLPELKRISIVHIVLAVLHVVRIIRSVIYQVHRQVDVLQVALQVPLLVPRQVAVQVALQVPHPVARPVSH
jgi:hypothetical protein